MADIARRSLPKKKCGPAPITILKRVPMQRPPTIVGRPGEHWATFRTTADRRAPPARRDAPGLFRSVSNLPCQLALAVGTARGPSRWHCSQTGQILIDLPSRKRGASKCQGSRMRVGGDFCPPVPCLKQSLPRERFRQQLVIGEGEIVTEPCGKIRLDGSCFRSSLSFGRLLAR